MTYPNNACMIVDKGGSGQGMGEYPQNDHGIRTEIGKDQLLKCFSESCDDRQMKSALP